MQIQLKRAIGLAFVCACYSFGAQTASADLQGFVREDPFVTPDDFDLVEEIEAPDSQSSFAFDLPSVTSGNVALIGSQYVDIYTSSEEETIFRGGIENLVISARIGGSGSTGRIFSLTFIDELATFGDGEFEIFAQNSGTGDSTGIDRIVFGSNTVSAIPIPPTAIILALGLGLAGVGSRFRFRK